jgi:hypothetical protein
MDDMSTSNSAGDDTVDQHSAEQVSSDSANLSKADGDYVNKTLQFLASASSETLGGIAVGLGACTYLVLGRLGLLLIGVTAGVVLHATWEKQNGANTEQERKEKGLDVIKRILELRDTNATTSNGNDVAEAAIDSFEGFQPETRSALNELVDVWSTPIHELNKRLTSDRQSFVTM